MDEEKASESTNAFKVRAYARAIKAIGQLQEPVRSVEQVRDLNGVGVRIASRVDAFLSGTPYNPEATAPSKSRKCSLEEARRRQIILSFKTIDGIGSVKATALYDAGCRSVADLRKPEFFEMLSPTQQISVRYMDKLERPVTPEQASTVRDFVEQNISTKYTVSISGDFRRGASSAPHITLLVLHSQPDTVIPPSHPPPSPSLNSEVTSYTIKPKKLPPPFAIGLSHNAHANSCSDASPLSTEIISPLECRGLVAATISAGVRKWVGIMRVPERGGNVNEDDVWQGRGERVQCVEIGKGEFRRTEIFCASHRSAGAASIALTGDSAFNLSIRGAASRHGYCLNEYGLWRWRDATGADTMGEFYNGEGVKKYGGYWDLVEGVSAKEEDIFEAVGMEWVAPDRRNFEFLDEMVASTKKRGRKKKVVV
ncbi:hypothetical protein BS17DRAFT_820090 [Gyrodon lividus]|nr:hypothetical protein BS17DRAFT_820090 [Gyrodon lividus]